MAQLPAIDKAEALEDRSETAGADCLSRTSAAPFALGSAHRTPTSEPTLTILSHVSSFTAHELVNPLGGLQTALSALATAGLDERSARLVNHCQQLTRRMLDMATDLRTLGGAHKPALEIVRVGDLIEGLFRSLVPPDGYHVSLALDGGATVHANGRLLSLALRNLVRNALDALPDGGSLGARIESHDSATRIVVWDEGPGIAPERWASLFRDPFTTKEGGSGLGLLLVKAIVERVHQGQVAFAPNEPSGASFQIDLPAPPPYACGETEHT